jgi:hypothetical protein
MPPRLLIATGAAINRDIIASNKRLTSRQIFALTINYKYTKTIIYRY